MSVEAGAPGARAPARAWVSVAALLAVLALLGAGLPSDWLVWRRDAPLQLWRWWTPVAVHWTPGHLIANLASCALLGWLGWSARLPAHAAIAWLLAWPLTHLGLWLDGPDSALQRYAGLSGVLHAGAAVAGLAMLADRTSGAMRALGAAVLAGLVWKLATEKPWAAAVATLEAWSFPVAVLAHATGALGGACAFWLVCLCVGFRRRHPAPDP